MTSPRSSLLLVPAVIAGLALGGCSLGSDGPTVSQTRKVDPFTRIDNKGSVDVDLRVGDRQRVVVRAGDKVVDDVHTDVHDGTLRISFDHDYVFGDDITVEATVPRLDAISASGSGDIDADGIEADAFEVRSNGSSDIELAGSVDRLAVDVDGSGDARLGDLVARDAHVVVSGSGDVDVNAGARLDVSVDGSGDVKYAGDPAVTKHIDGSGDLGRA